jgi:hypothetical protein
MLAQLSQHSYSRKMALLRRNAGFSCAGRLLLGYGRRFSNFSADAQCHSPIFQQFTA